MAAKPDLFTKLFRSAKKNLKKQKSEIKQSQAEKKNKPFPAASPREKQIPARTPAKIKIPLSGGKIDVYLTCPKKFHYSYIKKVRKGQNPGAHLCFDQSLHLALRDFYRQKLPEISFSLRLPRKRNLPRQ